MEFVFGDAYTDTITKQHVLHAFDVTWYDAIEVARSIQAPALTPRRIWDYSVHRAAGWSTLGNIESQLTPTRHDDLPTHLLIAPRRLYGVHRVQTVSGRQMSSDYM